MNRLNSNMIALAVSLAFSAGAMAATLSKDDYKARQNAIAAGFKIDKSACAALSGNPKDICVTEAKGKVKIAKADLDFVYNPSPKMHYKALVAKAEAKHSVAKERCDESNGNAKDVCLKEAKAARITAEAEATLQLKTTKADTTAYEKSIAAYNVANAKTVDAAKDATEETRDAQYAVAKEKCGTYAGTAKDLCLNQAKVRFSK